MSSSPGRARARGFRPSLPYCNRSFLPSGFRVEIVFKSWCRSFTRRVPYFVYVTDTVQFVRINEVSEWVCYNFGSQLARLLVAETVRAWHRYRYR